ncbi:hypothetical protein COL940_006732 [Colletotrichum noveboracense]|nr:hypothetical protein COL940_006732 [Colletotrichum noveboracense]KAJ0287252.1 hypothetical protein CBS470a_005435 [Colletotrichum nupharicola]
MSSLGIDLGTTFTCAFMGDEDGNLDILEFHHGHRVTRSVVQILNGKWSLPRPTDLPGRQRVHLALAKRLIGRTDHDGFLEEDMFTAPHAVIDNHKPVFQVGQDRIHPEEVSAFILGRIRNLASARSSAELTNCVLAVPAYFTHQQREATLDAAEIAGFHRQQVRLVPEPLAALVAHVEGNKSASDGHWFVIDIGGGTSDITITYIERTEERRSYVVKASAGDNNLGGINFDNSMEELVANSARICWKPEGEHIGQYYSEDGRVVDKLRLQAACEVAKEELSHTATTNVTLQDMTGDIIAEVAVTAKEAEETWKDEVSKVKELFRDALSQISPGKIGNVLVAGGMGNMACVKSIIGEMLPDAQIHYSHLSEAVGRGAAVIAGNPKIFMTSVLPRAIGVELENGVMGVVLERHEPLPAQARQTFGTTDSDTSTLCIQVYEGDYGQARQNILLGNFVVRNVPPGDTPVDVEINVDRLGEISVTAQADSSSGSLDIAYEPSHSPEELKSLGHLTSMRLEGKTSPATGQVKRAKNGGDSLKRGRDEDSPSKATFIPIKRARRVEVIESDSDE